MTNARRYLRWSAPHWRVYEVRDPAPLVEPLGGGAVEPLWVGHQGFALNVKTPGTFLVRVTIARASRPGIFRVAASFSLGNAWDAVTGARKTC